ncbi:50S ribosomal protein L13 [Candidatus Woesearchaeota archaeon]|jgi:large subunit ribosomal protein L13|nr:50S ribosomal protein L13 [Candidatus Woesearchaeota archaeon]
MKIIDAEGTILGRLASYSAKEALKGEEIIILNSEKAIITGRKENIKEYYESKRKRVGSTLKGPKVSRSSEKIVKRTIRGMLPNYRDGRGREALKRIKCYKGIPLEFKDKEKITLKDKFKTKGKSIKVEDISKK